MRALVVYCHPSPQSYGAALCRAACSALASAGHEVRLHDLYADAFDPVLTREEWDRYLERPEENRRGQAAYVGDLQWAEALVVIYPTWYYGPPAMLKGWLERVWLPGVTFEIATARGRRPRPLLRNIRRFVGVTTSGSPWWWLRLAGDPGRALWTRALRPTYGPRCRVVWRQLYNMNHTSAAERARFIETVAKTVRAL
jgi:putative NADPH-quinone reductase